MQQKELVPSPEGQQSKDLISTGKPQPDSPNKAMRFLSSARNLGGDLSAKVGNGLGSFAVAVSGIIKKSDEKESAKPLQKKPIDLQIDERKYPLLAEDQNLRVRLVDNRTLGISYYTGFENANELEDGLKPCDHLEAYLMARYPNIWCKINPYFECESEGRRPREDEQKKMQWLMNRSPLFYIKAQHPEEFETDFDQIVLRAFAKGGDIDQFYQIASERLGPAKAPRIIDAKNAFIFECSVFLPRLLVGEEFCQWVQVIGENVLPVKADNFMDLTNEDIRLITSANVQAISRLVLWRWGKYFDDVAKYLEGQVGKDAKKVAKICANSLLSALAQTPDDQQGFLLTDDEKGELVEKSSLANDPTYHLLLNLLSHLKSASVCLAVKADPAKYLSRRIAQKLAGLFDDSKSPTSLCAAVLKVTKCNIDYQGFLQRTEDLKREMLTMEALLEQRPLPALQGLQILFASGHPQTIELGRQLLWACTPAQWLNIAKKYSRCGQVFRDDVRLFGAPLLNQLLQVQGELRGVELVKVGETLAEDEKTLKELDDPHLAALLALDSPHIYQCIARYTQRLKTPDILIRVLAHPRVSVANTNSLLKCFSGNFLSSFAVFIAKNDIPIKALAKIIACRHVDLRAGTIENLLDHYDGFMLSELFTFQNPPEVIVNEISAVLVAFIKSPISLSEYFGRNIKYFLMCAKLLEDEFFIGRCCESSATAVRVLEALTEGGAAFPASIYSFLCAFVERLSRRNGVDFSKGELHDNLLKLLNRNKDLDRLLLQNIGLVVSMYNAKSLSDQQWGIIYDELSIGHLQDLLSVPGGLGARLWRHLCEPIDGENMGRVVVWLHKHLWQDELLGSFLLHLTRGQLTLLFNHADEDLTFRLFLVCEKNLLRVLYAVLNGCFADIKNPIFFQRLEASPELVEYAFNVALPQQVESFSRAYSQFPWMSNLLGQQRKPLKYPPNPQGNPEAKSHQMRVLRNCINNPVLSEQLLNLTLKVNFNYGDLDIICLLFANPVFTRKLASLQGSRQISIDIKRDVLPLLNWVSHQPDLLRVNHLFQHECLAKSLIGGVEYLFCLPTEDAADLLKRLFLSEFWRYLFSDLRVEQMAELLRLGFAVEERFKNEFAREFPERFHSYYAFNEDHADDFYERWQENASFPELFVKIFQYNRGQIERWTRLLSCGWINLAQEGHVFDKIIQFSKQLGLELFLKDLPHEDLVALLARKSVFAEKLLLNPVKAELLKCCNLRLEDFRKLPHEFFTRIISHPVLLRASGFTPEQFYQLVMNESSKAGMSSRRLDPFLNFLLSPGSGIFLQRVWLSAPTCIRQEISRHYVMPVARVDQRDWAAQGLLYRYEFKSRELSNQCVQETARLRSLFRQANDISAYVQILHATNMRLFGQGDSKALYLPWLEEALRLSLQHGLPSLSVYLKCYLNLPSFEPTLGDIPPQFLLTESIFTLVREQVRADIPRMVEYLIDICHNLDDNSVRAWGMTREAHYIPPPSIAPAQMWNTTLERGRELVMLGIDTYYGIYQRVGLDPVEAERFISLLCSATKLFHASVFYELFTSRPEMRDNVCTLLLSTSKLSSRQEAAVLRLQLILLRCFIQVADKARFVTSILSQLQCLTEEVVSWIHNTGALVESGYHLDLADLRLLRQHNGLVSLLRYPALTSRLAGQGALSSLIEIPAVARACLLYDHLFSVLERQGAVTYCLEQLGYGEDHWIIAEMLQTEMEFLVEHRPALKRWIEEVLSNRAGQEQNQGFRLM
jgi:hypothetical protein